FLELPGYNIRYSKSGLGLVSNILVQVPNIVSSIRRENKWLKAQLKEYNFDAVISDNRFGLYQNSVPGVFITHQLTIKSPFGAWSEKILQWANYRYVNRFSECWIPDGAGTDNLAGDLSHPKKNPVIPSFYIGPVSRFKKIRAEEKRRHLVIILSGPEPQRSIFEEILVNQLAHYNGSADFIRGLPSTETILPSTNQLRFYNHLPADELSKKIADAEFVISRSGYSTVMDLVRLGKKSILVPTPGQTEQKYLAHYLMQKGIAFCVAQKDFLLRDVLETAYKFRYNIPYYETLNLKETISNFISKLI
ncbi:MAG: glycosyltransferase, partial [Bacteroidota bacterium]